MQALRHGGQRLPSAVTIDTQWTQSFRTTFRSTDDNWQVDRGCRHQRPRLRIQSRAGHGMERWEWTCLRVSDRRVWRAKHLKTDAIRIVREIRRDMGDELSKRVAACGYRECAQFHTKTPYLKSVSERFFAVPLGDPRRKTGCGREIESRLGGERETSIDSIVVGDVTQRYRVGGDLMRSVKVGVYFHPYGTCTRPRGLPAVASFAPIPGRRERKHVLVTQNPVNGYAMTASSRSGQRGRRRHAQSAVLWTNTTVYAHRRHTRLRHPVRPEVNAKREDWTASFPFKRKGLVGKTPHGDRIQKGN